MATQTLENPVIQVSGTATVEPNVEVANLCEIKDGQVVTTSLRVAEIFSKQHKNVLQAIRELDCSDEFRGLNFKPSLKIRQLPNGMGERQDPYYLITRDGFVFLVMGFTGKTAAKFKEAYIRAFNVMEERLRRMQSSPQYTMADAPRLVHEHLERMEAEEQPIVESYGAQRVVSTVTLARLTGRKHENICASVRRMFKHTLRPARLFIRTGRTVRRGFGRGYDSEGVQYLITIEGFRVMCTHAEGLSEDVQKLVMSEFYKAKGKNRPGQPNPSTPKPSPTPPDDAPAGAQKQGPVMPKDAADMMARFVKAMAVMMGVDVNEVSNLISGGRK
ncbi:MAG: Rha family transcriptional regulator [Paludibacteraceae bacterium]|nr:Rha family transcriptional regulator [Paludibacteraceae bacterium]